MGEIYFCDYRKLNIQKNDLPENILNHCKKEESFCAYNELIKMGALNISFDKNGKPLAQNCYISVSHSNNMIAVCKSEHPIGIDIEYIGKIKDFDVLAKKYFQGQELTYYNNSKSAESFFDIWTKKEAYSKIIGRGILEIKKGFDIFNLDGYKFETEYFDDYIISTCEKI